MVVGQEWALTDVEVDVGVFGSWGADDLDQGLSSVGVNGLFIFLGDFLEECFVGVLVVWTERGVDVEAAVDTHCYSE